MEAIGPRVAGFDETRELHPRFIPSGRQGLANSAPDELRYRNTQRVCIRLRHCFEQTVCLDRGGVKDSAGASYRALVDPTNPFFWKVRDLKREGKAA